MRGNPGVPARRFQPFGKEEPVNIMNVLIMVRALGAAALITIVLIGATGACLCRA